MELLTLALSVSLLFTLLFPAAMDVFHGNGKVC